MYRIIIAVLFCLLSSQAWATTWYVRDGGGSSTQCTGTTNAVYTSGSGQPCAFNNPVWVMGGGDSGSTSGTVVKWVGGDTMSIDGDSDTSPGTQAQYGVGYGMANATGCSSGDYWNCQLVNIPAGSSGTHTKIIGTGTHKPQIYGLDHTYKILDAENSYIDLTWLEVTDHSACSFNNTNSDCSSGQWGSFGIVISGGNQVWTDVYIHGIQQFGVNVVDATTSMASMTFTRLWVIGNGYGGFTTGINNTLTGATWTFNQPIIEWNGCAESYPMTNAGIDNPANYHHCFGQNNGGYGDGLAFGAVGSQNAGSWTIIGPGSISWNTQDGLDILHGTNGVGTDNIDKMRFEGNAGNQIKLTGLTDNITNNLIIANCGWWWQSSQVDSGQMQYGDSCRAEGDAINTDIGNNTVITELNNTIFSNGNDVLFTKNNSGAGCNGSSAIHVKNNIIYGGANWLDDSTVNPGNNGGNQLTNYLLMGGSDGNGTGNCGTIAPDEDYNIVYNTKSSNGGCNGAHDKCGTSPGFVSALPAGTLNGNQSTFYNAWSGVTYMPISSSSAAKNAGNTGYTYWNNSNDYYNVTRTSPPSMGGLEVASCAASSYGCFFNSDCCGGVCSNNMCTGTCSSNGASCSSNGSCCSSLCQSSLCVSCLSNTQSCSSNGQCCSGICTGSVCVAPTNSTGIQSTLSGACLLSGKTVL